MYVLLKQCEEYNDEYTAIQEGVEIVAASDSSDSLEKLERRKESEELKWIAGGVDDHYYFGTDRFYDFTEKVNPTYSYEFKTTDPKLAKTFLKKFGSIFSIINLKDKKYDV